jgi:hypothetical protein
MSESVEEQLSALLDGELTVEEEELLFRRLNKNPEHSSVLSRYSLIRELVVSPTAVLTAMHLGERVRVALQDEIVVASGKKPGSKRGKRGRYLRVAAAAAVVAVAMTVFVDFDFETDSRQTVATVDPGLNYAIPESRANRGVIGPYRLTGYLVSHGEFSNSLSRRVMDSQIVSQSHRVAGAAYEHDYR